MMDDYLIRYELGDFESLNLYSRTIEVPDVHWGQGFTVSFWFWADDQIRRQDIISADVWTISIRDGVLAVHVQGMTAEPLCIPLSEARWHHAAFVVNTTDGEGIVSLTCDQHTISQQFDISRRWPFPKHLLIGGSTDPAGGHYDHTFGRRGTGLIDDFRIYARALTEPELSQSVPDEHPQPQLSIHIEPLTGVAPLDVQFNATVGHHPTAKIAAYLWDFGDGTHAIAAALNHRYEYAGQYSVRLRAIDEFHRQVEANEVLHLTGRENPLRFTPVFVNGTEGYACYRIPSIIATLNGSLLAFAEARLESCSDSTGTIHIVCKRSGDNGETWSPLTVVAAVDGFVNMNASPVVDEVYGTGKIIVVFRASDHSEWDIARGIGLSRALFVSSEDHGTTWSTPRDITAFVHKPYQPSYASICPAAALPENQQHDWRIQIPAQGHALQLRRLPQTRGRLFFAGSLTRGNRSIFESENYAFWSDDLGETWHIGGIIPRIGLNEAIAAELDNGDVLINTRAYTEQKPDGRRAITRLRFDAEGNVHFDVTTHDEALIDPAVQATLLRCTWSDQQEFGGKSRLLFANPAHPRARVNLTVRLSYDEGRTWAFSKVIDSGAAAYSDLVMMPTHDVGVLYERGNTGGITFVRFTLEWLTDGLDQR